MAPVGGTRAGVFGGGVAIPDPANDYDATQEATGTLSTWTDQSDTLDLSAVSAPSVVSDGINANKSVRFDVADDLMQASSASDWTFLHDGSQFSIYLVTECTNDGGFRSHLSTQTDGVVSDSSLGLTIARDDRNSENALNIAVANGSSNIVGEKLNDSYPPNSPEIFAIAFDGTDQYQIQRGTSGISSPTATGHATGSPDEALRVGYNPTTADGLGGDLGRIPIYKSYHDAETRDSVVNALADQFGITL